MDKLMRYTILAAIGGVILAFNMYHADYKLLIAQVGTILLLAIWLLKILFEVSPRTAGLRPNLGQIAMLAFLAVYILSFVLSPHKLASGQELYKVGTWIVFGMITGSVFEAKPRTSVRGFASDIVNVWLVCAGIAAIYGILQFFGIDFMEFRLPGGRVVSTFGNSTVFAGFLAMTLPLAFVKVLEKRGNAISYQLSAISLTIVLLTCLILTKSRGGILAAMVGIGTLYILRGRLRSSQGGALRPSRALIIIALGIIGGLILLMVPQVRHIVFDVVLRKTARAYIWKDAIQMIPRHPVLGTGIGTFVLYFPQVVSGSVLKIHPIAAEFIGHAHCEYLELLIETGIVGLALFLTVIAHVIKKAITEIQQNLGDIKNQTQKYVECGLFAAFFTILVHNIVGVDLRYTSTGMFFWMFVGILGSGTNKTTQYKISTARLNKHTSLKKIASILIVIGAISAIYYTARSYIYLYRVEKYIAKEEQFFGVDKEELNERIGRLEKSLGLSHGSWAIEASQALKETSILSLVEQIVAEQSVQGSASNTLNIERADSIFTLGVLYAKSKDFQKAKEYFIETIRINPHHAGAFNNLGNIMLLERDPGSAKGLFYMAAEAEPDNVEHLINVGYACFLLNEMAGAIEAVEKVLTIEPGNSRALLLKRQML